MELDGVIHNRLDDCGKAVFTMMINMMMTIIAAACGVSMLICEKTTTLIFLDLELQHHFIERNLLGKGE
jgi:hypothetical protein